MVNKSYRKFSATLTVALRVHITSVDNFYNLYSLYFVGFSASFYFHILKLIFISWGLAMTTSNLLLSLCAVIERAHARRSPDFP